MSWETRIGEIREKYGTEFVLRMLAEECSELSQACLKVIRARRKETPISKGEALAKMIEEMSDVWNMWMAVYYTLTDVQKKELDETERFKQYRMWDRMMSGGDEGGEGADAT